MTIGIARDALSNTLGLTSVAQRVFMASDQATVLDAARWAEEHRLPLLPLGAGSNVVLPTCLNAAVVYITDAAVTVLEDIDTQVRLRVSAGKNWHALVLECVDQGFHGLENLALIPGCVGAAPVQNIGAYGIELASFIEHVHGVDLAEKQPRTMSHDECAFAYRDSIFKHEMADRFVITAVDLRLSKGSQVNVSYPSLAACFEGQNVVPTPRQVCDAVIAVRSKRLPDPADEPNVGSFFKNPIVSASRATKLRADFPALPQHPLGDGSSKLSAAWMIEHVGLRAYEQGAAGISARHALVLVNRGGATQADVLALAAHVQEEVAARFDTQLEIEPRVFSGD